MDDMNDMSADGLSEHPASVEPPATGALPSDPETPLRPAPPIESRFLYVDVAALRAKQLRRGARLRFEGDVLSPVPFKPERAAMEEVRRRLVQYEVPESPGLTRDQGEGS